MANLRTRFAGYPSAVVYSKPHTTSTSNAVQHLLWGDWLELKDGVDGDWREVRARGVDGWMHQDEFTKERLLEVNFVDIGQGDGCLVVTPDDKFIVIDAGERDNMYRFLRWRFGRFANQVKFESFVITHGDKDHYYGFKALLEHRNVKVGTLYHNGIVERKGERLGPTRKFGKITYLDELISTRRQLTRLLSVEARKGSRQLYSGILRTAATGRRVDSIKMLSSRTNYVPGYGARQKLTMRVLGPVPELCPDRKWRLRRLGDDGVTKNGHSIVIRAEYGDVSVLLGGDLNVPAENYLLEHYTGANPAKKRGKDLKRLIAKARVTFQTDVMKACHHGSADFTEVFLRSVNAIATVISSGDEESHSHPRPEALGSFGLHGRGRRPLIFSTELARSSREVIKSPNRLRREIAELEEQAKSASTARARKSAKKKRDDLLEKALQRSVAVYGMITLRTDGKRVVIAQKLEQPRSNKSKWDIYKLEPNGDEGLVYRSKH